MAKKKHAPAPVPPDNQSSSGPHDASLVDDATGQLGTPPGASDQEQDPNRRLGDYVGKGEHSIQQPGGRHGADHGSSPKGDK